ncbi:hypothetical protein PR048_016335 [Dryococelus australis]|uniref:YqaJ viral recombinase domain-containing protein n=1 Tax=Dryococelus australis TaxID=614101 RepID=A0ABQ9HJG1_9NEOP|nr:hypothetical protein PR048_016335 [Dryococelus australis]
MEYGCCNEYVAIKWFEKVTGLGVQQCGLFVDLHHGASPDGLVAEDSILEVKCVPSAQGIGLKAMAGQRKGVYVQLNREIMRPGASHGPVLAVCAVTDLQPTCLLALTTWPVSEVASQL